MLNITGHQGNENQDHETPEEEVKCKSEWTFSGHVPLVAFGQSKPDTGAEKDITAVQGHPPRDARPAPRALLQPTWHSSSTHSTHPGLLPLFPSAFNTCHTSPTWLGLGEHGPSE